MPRIRTLRVDRIFPEVGRIAVASGATTKGERAKRDALLTRLYDRGRLYLLRAIRDGSLSLTEVYAADKESQLDTLTGDKAQLAAPLFAAVAAWVPGSALGEATRKRYAASFATLQRSAVLGEAATVAELASVDWKALQ